MDQEEDGRDHKYAADPQDAADHGNGGHAPSHAPGFAHTRTRMMHAGGC